MTPRRHTAWPPDRGWPAILDSQYADAIKPPSARTGDGWPPDRRPPIRSDVPHYWLVVFGAASGAFWSGLLVMLFSWHWWLLLPILAGAGFGYLFSNL